MIEPGAPPRVVAHEIMDSPNLDPADHRLALQGLARINSVSAVARRVLAPIVALARQKNLARLSLLDVACGGGDVPIAVALGARRLGIEIELLLMDRSQTAVLTATTRAKAAGLTCRPICGTIESPPIQGPLDIVTSTLFLHHQPDTARAVDTLRHLADLAGRLLIISDLRRGRVAWAAAWIGCRLLSRSPIVRYDGPASVRAAWTIAELSDMADKAGMVGHQLRRSWPMRMLLVWKRT